MTRLALHLLFFLSGGAALGYQLVWTRLFTTGLGHEYPAVLAIICAFMVGMALGAFGIDRISANSTRPGFWLAGAEITIGAWAILTAWLIPWANEWAITWIGPSGGSRQWAVAFILPALALLPATMAMGATFPAMERFLSSLAPGRAWVGTVYAANTLGAFAGTLFTAHVLMPTTGLAQSCFVLGAINLTVGMIIAGMSRRSAKPSGRAATVQHQPWITPRRLALTLFATGLLGIAYETVGVRVLSQVLEGTVFTYAAALAVFLAGTAAGAATYQRCWGRSEGAGAPTQSNRLSKLLLATTAACLTGLVMMALSSHAYSWARGSSYSPTRALAAEMLIAASVFLLPSFCMGALFTHLVQSARHASGRIGGFVAANTLGAAFAPVLAVIALPQLGTKVALLLISIAYLALALRPSRWAVTVLMVSGLAVGILCNLRIVQVPDGGRILAFREGVMAAVAVVEDPDRQRTLRVDNRYQMGGTAAADAEYRQAHIPLLLHSKPERALFLGLGTGISFGASSLYPGLTADGVELVPEVVEVMSAFAPQNFAPHTRPQLTTHVADARRFVRTSTTTYDVIIGDLFHPYRDGAGALYTREHFTAIRQRLNTNGFFCQWLPMHQLDEPTLKVIIRTFLEVFPVTEGWLLRLNVDVPVIGLVGRNHRPAYSNDWIETHAAPEVRDALTRLSLGDSLRFFGNFVASRDDLLRFTGDAQINTDDHPRVTFMAPRHNYESASVPSRSLFALLQAANPDVPMALGLNDPAFASRVVAYCRARDVYLGGLATYSAGKRDDAIEAYIASARLSPDFTAGYAQCLSIAAVFAKSDPPRARDLLEKLAQAQPERPVAREMLQRLTAP